MFSNALSKRKKEARTFSLWVKIHLLTQVYHMHIR